MTVAPILGMQSWPRSLLRPCQGRCAQCLRTASHRIRRPVAPWNRASRAMRSEGQQLAPARYRLIADLTAGGSVTRRIPGSHSRTMKRAEQPLPSADSSPQRKGQR
jgi:hypothetical protein